MRRMCLAAILRGFSGKSKIGPCAIRVSKPHSLSSLADAPRSELKAGKSHLKIVTVWKMLSTMARIKLFRRLGVSRSTDKGL